MSAKKKATRIKATVPTVVCQDGYQAANAIASIGTAQRQRQFIETRMNEELELVRQRYGAEAAPHADLIRDYALAVQNWANANRKGLTDDGKTKTVKLPSGEFSWRMTPKSVAVKSVENVIAMLKQMRLKRFLRVKVEINKEAILSEPAAVKDVRGISFKQREEFIIKPLETELEEVAP